MDFDTLPSGKPFAFWDDATEYRRAYHVACEDPRADDAGPGSADRPFRTISAAAARLAPGEKAIIHGGVYRECVRPARGGSGPDAMIAYEAADGETVIVRGSHLWRPEARASEGYSISGGGGARVWMADLPDVFADGYNPFCLRNAYQYLPVYGDTKDAGFLRRALLRRGALYADGKPMRQVYHFREMGEADGAWWAEEPGLRLHVRLPGDVDPADCTLELAVREQAFAPRVMGLGYIRVSGIAFEHAADGLPVPQRAAVSTMRGHHWIIEDCRVEWANACGMDIGAQTWDAAVPEVTGGHIVRRNAIRNCGICGLAGAKGVHHSLIEGNLIEHVGSLNLERMWECAGIKFHLAEHCLIRGNTLRHLQHAGGLWLDCSNVDNRVSRNVFADIECLTAALYSEMNYGVNLVDHNIFWDIRNASPGDERTGSASGGTAVRADCNEKLVVAHNFFGRIRDYAVSLNLLQSGRRHEGRTGLNRANAVLNNVFYACPHRVYLGRREENRCDGNLYSSAGDGCSFEVAFPQPGCLQDLAGWQEFFGLDAHSVQAELRASFGIDTAQLHWQAEAGGALPECQPVESAAGSFAAGRPGPDIG
jgi:hypothetical protein